MARVLVKQVLKGKTYRDLALSGRHEIKREF